MSNIKELCGPMGGEACQIFRIDEDCEESSSSVDVPQIDDLKCQTQEDHFIPFDRLTRRRLSLEFAEKSAELSDAARHLKAIMPDQTKRPLNAVSEQTTTSSSTSDINKACGGKDIFSIFANSSQHSSTKVRRYSGPQGNSQEVDNKEVLLDKFQRSFGVFKPSEPQSRLGRRRSSPDFTALLPLSAMNNQNTSSSTPSPPLPTEKKQPILPDRSFLGKMVGSGQSTSFFSSFAPKRFDPSSTSSLSSSPTTTAITTPSLTHSPSCPSLSAMDFQTTDSGADQSAVVTQSTHPVVRVSSSTFHTKPEAPVNPRGESAVVTAPKDNVDSKSADGFGFLTKTRRFGAWLTSAVEGEKVEISKKDLNVFAPTTF